MGVSPVANPDQDERNVERLPAYPGSSTLKRKSAAESHLPTRKQLRVSPQSQMVSYGHETSEKLEKPPQSEKTPEGKHTNVCCTSRYTKKGNTWADTIIRKEREVGGGGGEFTV